MKLHTGKFSAHGNLLWVAEPKIFGATLFMDGRRFYVIFGWMVHFPIFLGVLVQEKRASAPHLIAGRFHPFDRLT
jgi:hypothetical protein